MVRTCCPNVLRTGGTANCQRNLRQAADCDAACLVRWRGGDADGVLVRRGDRDRLAGPSPIATHPVPRHSAVIPLGTPVCVPIG